MMVLPSRTGPWVLFDQENRREASDLIEFHWTQSEVIKTRDDFHYFPHLCRNYRAFSLTPQLQQRGADFWPLDLSSTASSRSPAFRRWTWRAGPARPAQEAKGTRDGLNLLLQL
jgi:hypothetical protein